MASSGSFNQLPDELLVKIFAYLNVRDLVLNIQYVNSHWKAIVEDNSFWRDYVFTFDEQMAEKEIILLLKNMPALRALVAKRDATEEVIQTLCKTNKFITRLELECGDRFTILHLEMIVTNLPHIQHLAFPLSERDSKNAQKYSILIQKLHELVSLRLSGIGFNAENFFFLKGIASECPLLQSIDLEQHKFDTKDTILFLEAKKNVISKFFAQRTNSAEIIHLLSACKQLKALHFAHCGEILPNIPLFDLPNLQYLGINEYNEKDFSAIARNLQKTTLSNLLILNLSLCDLDSLQFENVLSNCVHLKLLILQFCDVPHMYDFDHIGKCIHLEYLDLHGSTITDLAMEVVGYRLRKLKYIDMSNCSMITDHSIRFLSRNKQLEIFKLSATNITGSDFKIFGEFFPKLRELHVKHCAKLLVNAVSKLQEQLPATKVYI